jgi:hypothetical protein
VSVFLLFQIDAMISHRARLTGTSFFKRGRVWRAAPLYRR